MNGLHILGTGRALPANIVTNDDLVLRVETSDEWIVSRTGIRERRFATHETLTQLAVEAARAALERAGVSPGAGAVPDCHGIPRLRHPLPGLPDPPGAAPAGGLPRL
ncbi:MAG: hypothetical protein ACLUJG_17810 [Lawsonibacter sp.]